MRVGMSYHLTLLLPLMTQIKDLTTGRHMIIASNSRWPTSYSVEIRCLLEILTSYSTSGQRLLPPTVMNHRFRRLRICTTLLIQPLSVTLHGILLVYSIMEPDLKVMFHHGWRPNMTSGSGIHALWSTTSFLILILSLALIMHHSKSAQLMDAIAFKTSFLQIGLGIKL